VSRPADGKSLGGFPSFRPSAERCRLIDLGACLSEKQRMPGDLARRGEDSKPGEPEPREHTTSSALINAV